MTLSWRVILWAIGMTLAGAIIGLAGGSGVLHLEFDYVLPCAAIGYGIGFLLGLSLDAFLPRKTHLD
jgi:hypothetical protein